MNRGIDYRSEPDSREFVVEQAGAKVVAVGSAIKALQTFSATQFDILLSDIGMPEMDGYSLMRQIRLLSEDQGGIIPAIALTAYPGEVDQQQALFGWISAACCQTRRSRNAGSCH